MPIIFYLIILLMQSFEIIMNIKYNIVKVCKYTSFICIIKNRIRMIIMKINYNGLWKVLIDKNMNKKDLMDRVGISTATVAKMTKSNSI